MSVPWQNGSHGLNSISIKAHKSRPSSLQAEWLEVKKSSCKFRPRYSPPPSLLQLLSLCLFMAFSTISGHGACYWTECEYRRGLKCPENYFVPIGEGNSAACWWPPMSKQDYCCEDDYPSSG